MNIVAATVVPAEPLRAATSARSRREALTTPPESWPSRSISSVVEADSQAAVDDRDRRRNGAHLARRVLDGKRRLDIARVGHAMGDDRRFERDDRLSWPSAPRRPRGKSPEDRRRSSLVDFRRWRPRSAAPRLSAISVHDQWRQFAAAKTPRLETACGPPDLALPSHRKRAKIRVDGRQARQRPGPAGPRASIRQARVENAERADAIAEVRELEIVRLKALESALEPVVDQAPQGRRPVRSGADAERASAPLPRHDRIRRHGARQAHLSIFSGHAPMAAC